MIYAHQIREVVSQLLSNAIDGDAFVQRFAAMSHLAYRDGDSGAVRIADAIESLLADVRCHCIGDLQFRVSLRSLIYADEVNSVSSMASLHTFPDQLNQRVEIPFPSQAVAGISNGAVSGSAMFLQA